jgi:hypothetical protein
METLTVISWIATLTIIISFFFDGNKLRYINGIGALIWTIWGIGMKEWAVVFLNVCIIFIHIYKLYKGKNVLEKRND